MQSATRGANSPSGGGRRAAKRPGRAAELAYTDTERDALLRAGQEAGKRLPRENAIQRYKGLGEGSALAASGRTPAGAGVQDEDRAG